VRQSLQGSTCPFNHAVVLLISFASDKEIPMFKCVSNTLEENPSCKLLEMFPVAENSREERVFFLRSQFLIHEMFINLYFTLILANNPRPFVNHVHKSFGCVVRSLHSQVQVFAFQAQHLLNPSDKVCLKIVLVALRSNCQDES